PRANPSQTYINTIPQFSNRNGAAVEVFVLNGSSSALTFNGDPVVDMVELGSPELAMANGGDNFALYFDDTQSGETWNAADIIDGFGFGSPSGPDSVVWGPGVTTTSSS